MTSTGTPPTRTGRRQRITSTIAAMGTAVLAGILALGGVTPAHAASAGAGYGSFPGMGPNNNGWQGQFIVDDGSGVYCIQPSTSTNPWAQSVKKGLIGRYGNVEGGMLAGMNKIISQYGQGSISNEQAAGLNIAVKRIVAGPALFDSHGYPNNAAWPRDDLAAFTRWVVYDDTNSSQRAEAGRLAAQYFAEAAATTPAIETPGHGTMEFAPDPHNPYKGTVTMVGTAGSAGWMVLENAVFEQNWSPALTGARPGVSYPIHVTAPSGVTEFTVSGQGSFDAPGRGHHASITLWASEGQQELAAPGGYTDKNFTVYGRETTPRSTVFLPTVGTTASAFVQPGEAFTDVLTFGTGAGTHGTATPWFPDTANGGYLPVTATGTVYGPFAAQPAESDTVPADAPVAATATLTTGQDGPTVQYTATTDARADQAGFYTWVWRIDASAQSAQTRPHLPEGYAFQDHFGQVAETSIVPSRIVAESQILDAEISVTDLTLDSLTVDADGFWLQREGENIPVTFRGTAYFVAGTTPPPVSDTVPDDAVSLGSVLLTVTEPGTYYPEGITAPATGSGFITWVWEILAEDQDPALQGWVHSWADRFGLPAETQTLAQPTVTTQALAGAGLGGVIHDLADISGRLPREGADLSFAAYLVPVTEHGSIARPEGAADGDFSWVCVAENLVFDNHGTPERVTAAGTYRSPDVLAEQHGMYLWIERLSAVAGEHAGAVIHAGECGIPNETTHVVDVTTQAWSESGAATAQPGEAIGDTAILTGWIPEAGTVTFEAYRTSGSQPMCTAETLAWTSPAVALTGGILADGLTVDSAAWTPEVQAAGSTVYWVQVTADSEGRVVARGECGEAGETMPIAPVSLPLTPGGPDLAVTGGTIAGGVLAAGAGALLVGLALLWRERARARSNS